MKICILGADFETGNMGVSTLTAGTIRCVVQQFPGAEIVLLGYGRSGSTFNLLVAGHQTSVRFVNMRFSIKFYLRNNIAVLSLLALALRVIPSRQLRQRVIFGSPCLKETYEADLIGSIAGGDSFSDVYGIERLLYATLPQILVLLMRKKLVLLPQTLGPFKSRFAKAIAGYIMRRAELIYSRDCAGVKLVAKMLAPNGSPGKVRFCYDVGFVLDPISPQRVDVVGLELPPRPASVMVGLNVSGLLFMGGYTRRNMFGLKVEYPKLVYDLIDFLAEQKKASVLLVPHVFGQHRESDATVCAQLYEALKDKYPGNIGWVRGSYNESEIKHVIGTCDFFIGSRMHACIAAVSQNVPAIPLAYSEKFVGVMQTIGVESNVVDLRTMDEQEVFNVLDRAFEQRVQIRQQLTQTMPQVKASVLSLFEGIGFGDLPATETVAVGKVPVGQ